MNTDKAFLRSKMKSLRARCPHDEAALAAAFFEADFSKEETFFVYRSYKAEAETGEIIARLKRMGKRVLSPRVEGDEMVAVPDCDGGERNERGIFECDGAPYEGRIDVAIVPLLAVDRRGARLGYGGGYYDKFLAKRACKRVALCYSWQIVDFVPDEPHDERMDCICTECGWQDTGNTI